MKTVTKTAKKSGAEKKKKESKPINPICAHCYRWGLFKEKCYFFWEGKKFCPSKVKSEEGLIMLERMRARA